LGRTIPSFRMVIDREIGRVMQTYGRSLSKQDRAVLENMLQLCTRHSQSCSASLKLVPIRSILFAVFLEQEKKLQALIEELSRATPLISAKKKNR